MDFCGGWNEREEEGEKLTIHFLTAIGGKKRGKEKLLS